MRLGLSTAAFYGRWETEEAAGEIARLHMDCAEVFLQTTSEYNLSFAALAREKLGDVPCTSVHPSGIQFENQMFGRSPRQRRDAFDMFRRALDAAQSLGAAYYVYHGKSTAQLSPLPFHLQSNIDMVGKMAEEAAERGLTIAWENVFWCQLTTCKRIEMVKASLPDVCFTLDIKQAMRAGEEPISMAGTMGKNLVNVHLCDWDEQGKLCLPGEGVFDFPAFFAALKRIGYDGPVVLEPYLALIKNDEKLKASIRYLRKAMDAVKRV